MQRLAFADQQIGIDGLARQRVAEGELLRRLLNDELGSDQLLDQLEEMMLIVVREFLQEGKIEAPSGHCRQSQDLPGRLTESIRALLHRVLHAARDLQLA